MHTLEPINNHSLRLRVYQALQQAIVRGELAPGARLRDLELATRLGVSRTPVREALQRLEDEGLVETNPRSATMVTALDARVAREAFPVVAALHALAARIATPALTAAHLDAMRAANETLRTLIATPDPANVLAAIAADDRFHTVCLEVAENREIVRALDRLMPRVRRLEYAQFGSLSGRKSVHQHEQILAACERGTPDAVAALVEENWLSLGQLIADSLAKREEHQREIPTARQTPRAEA